MSGSNTKTIEQANHVANLKWDSATSTWIPVTADETVSIDQTTYGTTNVVAAEGMIIDSDNTTANLGAFGSYTTKVFNMTKGQALSINLYYIGPQAGQLNIYESDNGTTFNAMVDDQHQVNVQYRQGISALNINGFPIKKKYAKVIFQSGDTAPTTSFNMSVIQTDRPLAQPGLESPYPIASTKIPLTAGSTYSAIGTLGQTVQNWEGIRGRIDIVTGSDKAGTVQIKEFLGGVAGTISGVVLQLPYANLGYQQRLSHKTNFEDIGVFYINGALDQVDFQMQTMLGGTRPQYPEAWTFAKSTATLTSGSTYTSGIVIAPTGEYSNVGCLVNADQAGTLYIDESDDGSTWVSKSYAVTASTVFKMDGYVKRANQLRIRYINGGVGQGSFLLVGTVSNSPAQPEISSLAKETGGNLDAILTELGQKTEPANQQHAIIDSGSVIATGPSDVVSTPVVLTNNGDSASIAISGFYGVSVTVVPTNLSATISFGTSYDGGTTYQASYVFNALGALIVTSVLSSNNTTASYVFPVVGGASHVNVSLSSATGGSVSVTFRKTAAIGMPLPSSGLNSGSAIGTSTQIGGQWKDVSDLLTPINMRSGTAISSDKGVVVKQPADISSRSDTYTGSANGTTVNVSTFSRQYFAIQVKGTGAAALAWDIVLEGSLDGTNFDTILEHTQTSGDGKILWFTVSAPCLYFRSRCVSVMLGDATNVIATILGRY